MSSGVNGVPSAVTLNLAGITSDSECVFGDDDDDSDMT